MKVKELIEKLQQFDENLTVVSTMNFEDWDSFHSPKESDIEIQEIELYNCGKDGFYTTNGMEENMYELYDYFYEGAAEDKLKFKDYLEQFEEENVLWIEL